MRPFFDIVKRHSPRSAPRAPRVRFLVATFVLASLPLAVSRTANLSAADQVTVRRDGREMRLDGTVLVTAEDNGLLLVTPDGVLWTLPPEEIVRRQQSPQPLAPLSPADQGRRMLEQLPPGFDVHRTKHYVLCYNTNQAYAQWTGALFERLYMAFHTYWTARGFKLHDSEFPLVAVVFADQASYAEHSRKELGDRAKSIVGYYSLYTNRMTLYDLTGVAAARRPGDRRGTTAQINEALARPEAEFNVATVVHEATHQLAYNCGMHARLADVPRWVSEGMAVYFETPDLKSDKGWRTIGATSRGRLATFRRYTATRPATSLSSLVADDARLRDPRQADVAYAEAWALNHFLLARHSKEYTAYLKLLADKGPLVFDTPAERLQAFRAAFGDDLDKLDAEFLRHVKQIR
jgi:hypothetical protein